VKNQSSKIAAYQRDTRSPAHELSRGKASAKS